MQQSKVVELCGENLEEVAQSLIQFFSGHTILANQTLGGSDRGSLCSAVVKIYRLSDPDISGLQIQIGDTRINFHNGYGKAEIVYAQNQLITRHFNNDQNLIEWIFTLDP